MLETRRMQWLTSSESFQFAFLSLFQLYLQDHFMFLREITCCHFGNLWCRYNDAEIEHSINRIKKGHMFEFHLVTYAWLHSFLMVIYIKRGSLSRNICILVKSANATIWYFRNLHEKSVQNLCIKIIFTTKCKGIAIKGIKGKIRKSEANKFRSHVFVSSVGHSLSLSSNDFLSSGDSNSQHEFQLMVVVSFSFSGFWKMLVLKRRMGRLVHCSTCGYLWMGL